MSQSEEKRWSHYYQAVAGREPRPLLIESGACELATSSVRWAVDLGCGDGTETVALLRAGWHVLAIDRQPEAIALVQSNVPPELLPRLQARVAGFETLQLPPVDFVYAGFSLPFCAPEYFSTLWNTIVAALGPGGMFAGQLFGERDSWAGRPAMTFHTRAGVQALLEGFAITTLSEVEEDGQAVSGPKHWHVFHVIARKRLLGSP